jgi:hypothetical protein
MIITWYADFDETAKDLESVNGFFGEIIRKIGGSADGPYYPQSAALMYIFKVSSYDWLNQCGRRIFLKRAEEEGIKITPARYEDAVTPEEFWGRQ